MKRIDILSLAVSGMLIAFGVSNAFGAEAGKLPRYSFEPGFYFKYESSGESKDKDGKSQYKTSNVTEFWVLAPAQPSGWSLFVVASDTYIGEGETASTATPRVSAGLVTLRLDGTTECSDGLKTANVLAPLIPLPQSEDEAENGWKGAVDLDGGAPRYTPQTSLADTERLWAITRTSDAPMDKVYEMTRSDNIVFDVRAKVVSAIDSTYKQQYGFQSEGTSNTKLSHIDKLPAEKLDSLREHAPSLVKALDAYDQLIGYAKAPSDQLPKLIAASLEEVRGAAAPIELEVVKQLVEQRAKQQESNLQYAVEAAKRREGMVGKAAPDWKLTSLDASSHSLAECRGKVVLLDFWYRGCGWCIRSMPQLSALATAYKDKPVAVYGMNVDEKEDDAKFVAETMHLAYTTLRGGSMQSDDSVAKKYNVRGYPTLIVIDKDGKVNDVLCGYSPSLKEELSRKIDALL